MRKMTADDFDGLVQFFDNMARTNWLGSIHDQLKKMTGDWKGKHILDVGCGTGRVLLRGAHEAENVTGIDISAEMVKAAQENFLLHNLSSKAEFITADAYDLPFTDQQFDISISTCVLFLLPEPERGISEMIRVTKNGGMIAMLNPSADMNQKRAADYCKNHGVSGFEQNSLLRWSNVSVRRHRYNKEQLTALLCKKGADHVIHKEVLNGLAMITAAKVNV